MQNAWLEAFLADSGKNLAREPDEKQRIKK